ncbi:hypothetical protein Nepgr_012261 [Nepenthes gracilis]|uniref:Uncharacterized protein n=1 Tax=Nepenthes gracilis TaxID=150966 RepID=A0AAD3SGM3_NEPGR|nr:hypothetical protein Nepgr_012261 [Nepenthes gracilis]
MDEEETALVRLSGCLVIQLWHLDRLPQSLIDCLQSPSVCFVAVAINPRTLIPCLLGDAKLKAAGVTVDELAAKVLEKPGLLDYHCES